MLTFLVVLGSPARPWARQPFWGTSAWTSWRSLLARDAAGDEFVGSNFDGGAGRGGQHGRSSATQQDVMLLHTLPLQLDLISAFLS